MTPAARLGGLALSLLLHAGAGTALLALSATDWAHPLFVDLLERSDAPAGPAGAGTPATRGPRAAALPTPGRASRESATRSGPAAPPPDAVAPALTPAPSAVVPVDPAVLPPIVPAPP